MRALFLGVVAVALVGCGSEPVHAQKEPTVDQRLKLIHKQDEIPQASKDGIDQLVKSYNDKDEFERTGSK